MCWHNWSSWKVLHQADIISVRTEAIIGYLFVQCKTCSKCGYTKIKEHRISAN